MFPFCSVIFTLNFDPVKILCTKQREKSRDKEEEEEGGEDPRKHFNEHVVGNSKNPKQYTIGILHCSKAGATYNMKTN